MEYVELICKIDVLEPWREILIAQLADAGFDSFEETYDGFRAYIVADDFNEDLLQQAMALPGAEENPVKSVSHAVFKAVNWNQEWEKRFEPIWITDKLYVRAPFHDANPDAAVEVVIEPRMSFGTGHHQTTRLVAMWLLEAGWEGKSVLDMGCGTGILAILAAKLGASRIVAIDNYQFAFENAQDNVLRNGFPGIQVIHGDASVLGKESFDLVIANITRNVLIDDMPKYVHVLNKGGCLILSGFLFQDKHLIEKQAIKLGLQAIGEKILEDWVSLKFIKP